MRSFLLAAASVAAARPDNGPSVAGVCWDCEILPLKVLDDAMGGHDSWRAAGLVYVADRGVPVLSVSMGGTGGSTPSRDAIRDAAFYDERGAAGATVRDSRRGTRPRPERAPRRAPS